MARRVTAEELEGKKGISGVRVLSKKKVSQDPRGAGIDARVVTEIFLKACNHMIEAFQRMKPPTVIVPEIKIPPSPEPRKPSRVVISKITRNNQNRIEGVEMDVFYNDGEGK